MGGGRVVDVDVEVTSDYQWHWEHRQATQQVAEVVEERLRRRDRARSVDDADDGGVGTGAVEERGNDLEQLANSFRYYQPSACLSSIR